MNKILRNTLCGLMAVTLAAMPINVYATANTQEETIYVKLQPNGEVDYSSVSKHLFNNSRSETLTDITILQDVENINGFETYKINNNQLIWQANGNDIYYKGKTEKALPIAVEVTYKLNDETKTLDEILGKSGKVEIHFHYKNLSKVGNLYTPFVVAMATTLPESAHNINVTNGKVISNGRNYAVTALAAPGLYDSLQINELKSLDDIILTYETDDFALNDIYNVATPKLLDQSDLKIFDEVDKLSNDAQKLADGSKELVEGSNNLKNGIAELRNGIVKAQIQLENTGSLLNEQMLDEIAETAANAARKEIAKQQDVIRAQVHKQLTNMGELGQIQENVVNQLAQAKALEVCLKSAQNPQPAPVKPSTGEDNDQAADEESAPITANSEASVIAKCSDPTVLAQYAAAVKPEVAKQVAAQFSLTTIEEKMFQSTYASVRQVAAETAATTARNVASQVADSIQKGFGDKLNVMMGEMVKGIDQLFDGAQKLSEGMSKFDREGIQTLNNVVNSKLKNTSTKAKRLMQLADEYNNFSGINEGSEGDVKFILMIDAKKK